MQHVTYILIVNYQTHLNTVECLESIFKQTYQNFKVIVVDNSKSDESLNYLQSWCRGNVKIVHTRYPLLVEPLVTKPIAYKLYDESDNYSADCEEQLIFIRAKNNDGFAAANNVGLKYLINQEDFEWVWLLNNDTVIYPDCLDRFVNSKKIGPEVGMAGTKLFYYHNHQLMQGIGGKFNKWIGSTRHIAENEPDTGQYDNIKIDNAVDYIIGASMFVSRKFVQSVGLMCEDYFLYFEELDWITRGKQKGWLFTWIPDCKVLHKEGATISSNGGKSIINDVSSVSSRLKFIRKFFPAFLLINYPLLILVFLNRIRRGQINRVLLLFKAVFLNQHLKKVLKIQ